MGSSMVVDGFMVVVAGGVGSLLGSIYSAGMLGEINGVAAWATQRYRGPRYRVRRGILIIVLKPQGLFSYKGR